MRRVYVLGVVGLGEELFDIRRRSVSEFSTNCSISPACPVTTSDAFVLINTARKVIHTNEGKPTSYFCQANLVDFAAPIMLGDRMIGSFIGGQVLAEEPD